MSVELRAGPSLDAEAFTIEGPVKLEIQQGGHPPEYAKVKVVESSDGKHPQEVLYLAWPEPLTKP